MNFDKKNPREFVDEEKFCTYIYPEGDPKAGERCRAIRMKDSPFCYFHQPDQTRVMEQLKEARESRNGPPNEKHGFYTQGNKECDKCSFAGRCDYYEEGKKVCDYQLKPDINLAELNSIQKLAEEIVQTEMQRYRKLEPFFQLDAENAELFELSSKISKRLLSTLKDYAVIKDTYEKKQKPVGWEDLLK